MTLLSFVIQFMCSDFYIPSISDILCYVSFSVYLISLRVIVPKGTHDAATRLRTWISWLSDIPLYVSTTTSLSILLFPGVLQVY